VILTSIYLAGVINTDSCHVRKRDLQRAFPLDVPPERLTCSGFSLGKTVHLKNFEFIIDYFSGLSLSPRMGDLGHCFHGLNSQQGIYPMAGHD
jgi:hypothetical protein